MDPVPGPVKPSSRKKGSFSFNLAPAAKPRGKPKLQNFIGADLAAAGGGGPNSDDSPNGLRSKPPFSR